MEIKPIRSNTTFKAYTNNDIYRLEQKIDQLNAQLDDGSLHDFYKDLPKVRRLPMPLGVPPYVMAGMPAPSYSMPPMGGPMGMLPMGMPPIGPMGGPMGPYGYGGPMGTYAPTAPMGPYTLPPIGMPPSRLAGQPPMDTFNSRK